MAKWWMKFLNNYPQGYELLPIVGKKYFLAFVFDQELLGAWTSVGRIGSKKIPVLIPISQVKSLSCSAPISGYIIVSFKDEYSSCSKVSYFKQLLRESGKSLYKWRGHL